ncbi:MAG: hypothetical protein JEZ12_09200 [Desulfobacterium sp.]|nr:hypothetical protein [Desulfobacterium sp.]
MGINQSGPLGSKRSPPGFSTVELLVAMVILSLICMGLNQVLAVLFKAEVTSRSKQALLIEARQTMDHLAGFVRVCDVVAKPNGPDQEILRISERLLDCHDNTTHLFKIEGDGLLDADNDGDGVVNEGGGDPYEFVTMDLDKGDPDNWKLREERPDYTTAALDDYLPRFILCQGVTNFSCTLLAPGLVEIHLALGNGENGISLTTRVKTAH